MTRTRVLTAVVLVPLVVAAVWWGPPWLIALLVAASTFLCLREFFQVCRQAGLPAGERTTLFCSALILLGQWAGRSVPSGDAGSTGSLLPPVELMLFVCLLVLSGQVLASGSDFKKALSTFSVSLAGLLLIALPLSYLILIRGDSPRGREFILFVLAIVWAGDTVAYFVGRALGKHPLAQNVSPKKTWEGAVGNVLASAAVGYLFSLRLSPEFRVHMMVLAVLASLAGQAGDLVESAFKRGAGVKDSGTLVPGHGGVWDRLDALIFAAPVAWWYLSSLLGSPENVIQGLR